MWRALLLFGRGAAIFGGRGRIPEMTFDRSFFQFSLAKLCLLMVVCCLAAWEVKLFNDFREGKFKLPDVKKHENPYHLAPVR